MQLIDSQGRLLGVVNVIDALVVLLVLGVSFAGIAVVLGGPDTDQDTVETETTHATLDLGVLPESIADALNEGDRYSPRGRNQLTVTDVYLAPQEDEVRALARVELVGPPIESNTINIAYDGAPPRLGRSLAISTDKYNVSGTIQTVGGGPSLDTNQTRAVLRATVPTETARQMRAGTRSIVAGRTVATVQDVAIFENDPPDRRHVIGLLDLETYQIDDRRYFGGTPLYPRASITLPLDDGMVTGTVDRLGPESSLGRETKEVLVRTTVPAEDAPRIDVGDTFTTAGREIGTVESVTVYGTENLEWKRVYVGLTLETVTHRNGPHFGGTGLRENATIPFRTDEYELEGSVVRLGATEERGVERTRTVTLQMQNLRPTRADTVREGMAERAGGKTIARLLEVERKPSQVVVTSQNGDIFLRDHPVNQDLIASAELTVREVGNTVRFKGRAIQPGSNVTMDLDGVIVRAEVRSL